MTIVGTALPYHLLYTIIHSLARLRTPVDSRLRFGNVTTSCMQFFSGSSQTSVLVSLKARHPEPQRLPSYPCCCKTSEMLRSPAGTQAQPQVRLNPRLTFSIPGSEKAHLFKFHSKIPHDVGRLQPTVRHCPLRNPEAASPKANAYERCPRT